MDNYISMGTTPTIIATLKDTEGNNLDFSLIDTSSFRVYLKQRGGQTIEKSGRDVMSFVGLSQVQTTLSQEDLFKFQRDNDILLEIRWLFRETYDGETPKAGKTGIYELHFGSALKKEVIT